MACLKSKLAGSEDEKFEVSFKKTSGQVAGTKTDE